MPLVLHHDADLLHQRASRISGTPTQDGGRRDRALAPARSSDDVFFLTGHRRARPESRTGGAGGRRRTERVCRPDGGEVPRRCAELLNISNDDFIRTTEPRHKRAAQAIWRRVAERGYLYKASYEGWYCTVDELFVPEKQLVDGRVPDLRQAGRAAERRKLFLPAVAVHRAAARALPRESGIRRRRTSAATRWRRSSPPACEISSVSRTSFKWGIPVPGDPAHVMYVWFDALTNYLTAAGFPDDETRARASSGRPTST